MLACVKISLVSSSCLQVIAALQRLAPIICFGLFMLAVFYSLLDPVLLCTVTKIARDAVEAMLPYITSPQTASCALMVSAVCAALFEVYP